MLSNGGKKRSHEHDYQAQSIGADLQRRICAACGQVSIGVSDAGTSETGDPDRPGLFSTLTPALGPATLEDTGPLYQTPRFGERRHRRR